MRGAASRHSSSIAGNDPGPSGRRTITTRSNGDGQSARVARNASRTSRLARFRTTAFPTRRDAVMPSRGFSHPGGQGAIRKMKPGATTRPPASWTRVKSERFRSRSHALKRPFGRGAFTRLFLGRARHGQTPAPTAPAVLQNGSPAPRLHASAEAVSSEATEIMGLVGAFHCCPRRVTAASCGQTDCSGSVRRGTPGTPSTS